MNQPQEIRRTRCPQCGRRFEYAAVEPPTHLPFCRRRCQWADLNKWLEGDYSVSRDIFSSDDEQID
jgi:endogenous inhibitor of DNA gyrase (YacG/DUF329 family)